MQVTYIITVRFEISVACKGFEKTIQMQVNKFIAYHFQYRNVRVIFPSNHLHGSFYDLSFKLNLLKYNSRPVPSDSPKLCRCGRRLR